MAALRAAVKTAAASDAADRTALRSAAVPILRLASPNSTAIMTSTISSSASVNASLRVGEPTTVGCRVGGGPLHWYPMRRCYGFARVERTSFRCRSEHSDATHVFPEFTMRL